MQSKKNKKHNMQSSITASTQDKMLWFWLLRLTASGSFYQALGVFQSLHFKSDSLFIIIISYFIIFPRLLSISRDRVADPLLIHCWKSHRKHQFNWTKISFLQLNKQVSLIFWIITKQLHCTVCLFKPFCSLVSIGHSWTSSGYIVPYCIVLF